MFGSGVQLCVSAVTTCVVSMLSKLSKLTACQRRFCDILRAMSTVT